MTGFSLIPKIRLRCLDRQSSDKRVRHNKESHDLQYRLAERTSALSCREVDVIRLDLAAGTDIGSTRREGSDCARSSGALGDIVIAWKASRLSCRDKEWRRRFDICRELGTILRDDPLVLGNVLPGGFYIGSCTKSQRPIESHSVETKHDVAFDPFHPFPTSILGIAVKPKRRGVVVSAPDPNTRDLQFPLRIPLPDSAETRIAELAPLRRKTSMVFTPPPTTLLDADGKTHDNLPKTVFDAYNGGGDRAATTTSEPNPNGGVACTYRPNDSSRTGRSHGPHSGCDFPSGRRKTQ